MREAIERRGAILVHLPAYSPDLNPIEQMFSKLKSVLRTTLCKTISACLDEISQAECVASSRIRDMVNLNGKRSKHLVEVLAQFAGAGSLSTITFALTAWNNSQVGASATWGPPKCHAFDMRQGW